MRTYRLFATPNSPTPAPSLLPMRHTRTRDAKPALTAKKGSCTRLASTRQAAQRTSLSSSSGNFDLDLEFEVDPELDSENGVSLEAVGSVEYGLAVLAPIVMDSKRGANRRG